MEHQITTSMLNFKQWDVHLQKIFMKDNLNQLHDSYDNV